MYNPPIFYRIRKGKDAHYYNRYIVTKGYNTFKQYKFTHARENCVGSVGNDLLIILSEIKKNCQAGQRMVVIFDKALFD